MEARHIEIKFEQKELYSFAAGKLAITTVILHNQHPSLVYPLVSIHLGRKLFNKKIWVLLQIHSCPLAIVENYFHKKYGLFVKDI